MKIKRKIWILATIIVVLLAFLSYLGYANYVWSFSYLPNWYDTRWSEHLSLTASGSLNAMDYYPWGYWIHIKKDNNWDKKLTGFWIKKPYLAEDENYSNDVVCTSRWNPIFCLDIKYVFLWKDPQGRSISSEIYWSDFFWENGYVNLIDKIIENAVISWTSDKVDSLVVKPWNNELLTVKVYWEDDMENTWRSLYKNLSKKFVIKVKKDEAYAWIAHSDKELWPDWAWDVSAERLWEMNYATVNVKWHTDWVLKYTSWVWPNDDEVKIVTVDNDNYRIDRTSTPDMLPYIDIYALRKKDDWSFYTVDKNGNESSEPFHRISSNPDGDSYWVFTVPATNLSTTAHSVWPSWSFLCNKWTIWTPWFLECYNDGTSFKWIMQYSIQIPEHDDFQLLKFVLKNASSWNDWAPANSFAIAWDIDMYWTDEITDDELMDLVVSDVWEDSIWNRNRVTWTTFVEVDDKEPDMEADFDDHLKETKSRYLHTYKTEVCNSTDNQVSNVQVKLNKDELTTLVWDWDGLDSTLILNASALDANIDESQRLPIDTFGTQINLWTLAKDECKFVTYQTVVKNEATTWDIIAVKNQYSYDSWDFADTNEVINWITALAINAEVYLESAPASGSEVEMWDYITYNFIVENTGLNDISSGRVTCPRLWDTTETECRIWDDCGSVYEFTDLDEWAQNRISYSVKVKNWLDNWHEFTETCRLTYDDNWEEKVKDSNTVNHKVVIPGIQPDSTWTNIIKWWNFTFRIKTQSRLLNSPDWEPRLDGYDRDYIRYKYNYTGSNHEYMYPELSKTWGFTDSRGGCDDLDWPYQPNAITYNINSSSTSPMDYVNLSSNSMRFDVWTTLLSWTPTTILHSWTLTPSHYLSWSLANSWFKNGWEQNLPTESTEHRAIVNGPISDVNSIITNTTYLDKWQYVPYDTEMCSYDYACWDSWCKTRSIPYTLYQWELVDREVVNFTDQHYAWVVVTSSTAWLKTSNWHVHTNDRLSEDWTSANRYDLWDDVNTDVMSSPKLYAPPGSFHWDYVVSSNDDDSSLKSSKWWYLMWKDVQMWHWSIYDREHNPRNFYEDITERQMYWKVIEKNNTFEDSIETELNHIYHYKWDLTLENLSWKVLVSGPKATIVVDWDLYINSDVEYSKENVSSSKLMSFLGIIVKGDIYVHEDVEYTVWAWHVEWTLHTWPWVKTLKHLWSWTVWDIDLERKAPENYERDVNEPSERIIFDDQIYFLTPPGFAELDDGIWSIKTNINNFSWKEIEW